MRLTLDTSQIFPAVGRALMGHGAYPGVGGHRKLAFLESLLEITRPFLVVMGVPAVGMGAVLAGVLPPPPALLLGIVAVMLSVSGIHAFNDWVDRKRDVTVWENRPIPSGRMSAGFALVLSQLFFIGALLITWLVFGTTTASVLLIALALGMCYCLFLRDVVGYLSLPPVIAIFPLGGWAAVSPDTLFTTPLPWFLALIVLTWQAAHIMVYMPAHPIFLEKGKKRCEKKAFFFYPTPGQAAALGSIFSLLLLAGTVLLGIVESLGIVYWIMAVPSSLVTLLTALKLLASPQSKGRAILSFNAASMALAFISGGVCLDVMARAYLHILLLWLGQAAETFSHWVVTGAGDMDRFIYPAVMVVAIFVTLASVGKIVKEFGVEGTTGSGSSGPTQDSR